MKIGKASIYFLFFIYCTFSATLSLATNYYGSVTDPSGDAINNQFDFISGSASISGGNLILTTTFAPGTFDWGTAAITANLDIDKNPNTGWSGIDSGHTDSNIFGTDYLVTWGGSSIFGAYSLWQYTGGNWVVVDSNFMTMHSADSTSVILPLSDFSSNLGLINFDFLSQKVLDARFTTTILDYMPNPGSYGTTAPVPEPSTFVLLGTCLVGLVGMILRRRER